MLEELLKDPSKIGATILLLAAVAAFFREWIVPGARYQREIDLLRAERDEFKLKAWQALDITERTQKIRGRLSKDPSDAP